jgi:hypothetical protein
MAAFIPIFGAAVLVALVGLDTPQLFISITLIDTITEANIIAFTDFTIGYLLE